MPMRGDPTRYVDIKTKRGREIYDAAVQKSGRIQAEREKYKMGSQEFERLTKEDIKTLSEGREKAMALNPKSKPKRKLAARKK